MSAFGIRRPLRFLSHKLDLDESQTTVLAAVLDDVKTERAQADVDKGRAQKLLSEAFAGESFDEDKAKQATRLRTESTERVLKLTAEGLKSFHAVLDDNQRQRLATMMRVGPFVF